MLLKFQATRRILSRETVNRISQINILYFGINKLKATIAINYSPSLLIETGFLKELILHQYLKICIKGKSVIVCFVTHDAHTLVFTHSFFEEVGFALQGDVLHKIKGILRAIKLQEKQKKKNGFKNVTYKTYKVC